MPLRNIPSQRLNVSMLRFSLTTHDWSMPWQVISEPCLNRSPVYFAISSQFISETSRSLLCRSPTLLNLATPLRTILCNSDTLPRYQCRRLATLCHYIVWLCLDNTFPSLNAAPRCLYQAIISSRSLLRLCVSPLDHALAAQCRYTAFLCLYSANFSLLCLRLSSPCNAMPKQIMSNQRLYRSHHFDTETRLNNAIAYPVLTMPSHFLSEHFRNTSLPNFANP